MRQAFAYLRVSGKAQIEGDGFTRQLKAIQDYAAFNGIQIVQVFEERGVTGTSDLDFRPALQDIFNALAASDSVTLVMIEKLDRLARDLMVQETILADMRKRGFELLSVMEPDLCKEDFTRVLMRQIFGAIAQYEKSMLVAKLKGARIRKKAETGWCEGERPFGYREGEQAILDKILELRREKMSCTKIAEYLNETGAPTRRRGNSQWRTHTVIRMVRRNGMPVTRGKIA